RGFAAGRFRRADVDPRTSQVAAAMKRVQAEPRQRAHANLARIATRMFQAFSMPGFASLYTSCCVLPLLVAGATHAAVPDAATVVAAEKKFAQTMANDHGLNEAEV